MCRIILVNIALLIPSAGAEAPIGGPLRILFGDGARESASSQDSWYGRRGYRMNNYDAMRHLFPSDGFNDLIFNLNRAGEQSGIMNWETHVPLFAPHALASMEANLRSAREAGLSVGVSMFTGGLANALAAKEHPDWRQKGSLGDRLSYMGPLVCWNSPYWRSHLLPLYRELFAEYGDSIQSLVLWEGPIGACHNKHCEETHRRSGVSNRIEWERKERLSKWRELVGAIRSTGWRGAIIGGGWAAYEWEEQMWDGTIYDRSWRRAMPEKEAFRSGVIDAIMPELYVHSLYGPHYYRREDAHYVYRSLVYERSVFGDAIIPAVELFWERSILPHELLRWLLEAWSAGFGSYAVVDEAKLYFERRHETQTRYRSSYREILRRVSKLPAPGKPRPSFVFVVSEGLERATDAAPLMSISAQDWEPRCFVDGRTARASLHLRPSALIMTPPNADCSLNLVVDNSLRGDWSVWLDFWDGGDWKDERVGEFELTGGGSWRTITMPFPAASCIRARDASRAPGKQIALRFWGAHGERPLESLVLDGLSLETREGRIIADLDVGGVSDEGLWRWYVVQLSRSFKTVDRALGGGCIANERPAEAASRWDETFGDAPQICVVPKGESAPRCSSNNALQISVPLGAPLNRFAERIIKFVREHTDTPVQCKSPLVAVNCQRDANGQQYIVVINHSSAPGEASLRVRAVDVTLSSSFIERQVKVSSDNDATRIHLDPYAAAVLRVEKK